MENTDRMIAAAKRLARRIARKSDLTYQQALDKVAQDLGREHWSSFLASPVEVPRDEAPQPQINESSEEIAPYHRDVWNLPKASRDAQFGGIDFIPRNNILVGDQFPAEGEKRNAYVEGVVLTLFPWAKEDSYFDRKGKEALQGLIHLELALAKKERRRPSMITMIDWFIDISKNGALLDIDGFKNGLGQTLEEKLNSVEEGSDAHQARRALFPLISTPPNERSAILGTADKGLLPFKNVVVRQMNA